MIECPDCHSGRAWTGRAPVDSEDDTTEKCQRCNGTSVLQCANGCRAPALDPKTLECADCRLVDAEHAAKLRAEVAGHA